MSEGIVAAGDPRTAAVGASLLSAGGNAVDAAVGATFAAWVCEPILTAPFGGGFGIVGGHQTGQVYDFFANVPGLGLPDAKEQRGLDFLPLEVSFGPTTQVFHVGRGAAAVPMLLPGLVRLHEEHGTLPLQQVVEPSIDLAENGVPISDRIAPFLKVLEPILRLTKPTEKIFAPSGSVLAVGERLVNKDLGQLLRSITDGDLDEAKAELLEGFGPPHGRLTEMDMRSAGTRVLTPVIEEIAGYEIELNPPPSSGGLLVAFGLRLLENVPGSVWENDTDSLLHILSAMAVTNAARASGLDDLLRARDPEVVDAAAHKFLSDTFVDSWREDFARATREKLPSDGFTPKHFGSTTHISVLDRQGLACAITSSNGEGCGHLVPGAGAMANNFMGEEDLHPHGFHTQPAGQRLTSMMCPTLVMRGGKPVLVLGTGGSNRIRTAVLQVMVHHLLRGLSIEDAVRAPRMHYEGECLYVEATGPGIAMDTSTLDTLVDRVHDSVVFESPNMFFGGVHAAAAGGQGAGDPRRGGAVARG